MAVFTKTWKLLQQTSLMCLFVVGCTDGFDQTSTLSKRSDGTAAHPTDDKGSEEGGGKENDNDLATIPTNITGTYLTDHFIGCEYVIKPTFENPQGQLGCRLSRKGDGRKVSVASLDGNWQWTISTRDPAAMEITRKASVDIPTWDVIYDLNFTSDKPLADTEKGIIIGIEDKDSSRSEKESLAEVQGRLTILIAGNWQEIRSNEQKCFTNSVMQYKDLAGVDHILYFRNYFENTLTIQGERTDYFFDDPTCSGQPDYSSKVEQDYTVQRFDGEVYDIDYLLQKWLVTPYSRLGLEITQREYSCSSFTAQQHRLKRQSNIISCWPEDIKTFYTSMKYQDPNKLFLGQSSDPTAGYSPDSRLREFKTDVRFEKISR